MRIDPECLRDVLICVEENTGWHKHCVFIDYNRSKAMSDTLGSHDKIAQYQTDLMEKHDCNTILYHLRYCIQDGLMEEINGSSSYRMLISDLTPKGHQFIAKIRDERQWKSVKKGLAAVRNYSLSAISAVADGVTSGAISAFFGSDNP